MRRTLVVIAALAALACKEQPKEQPAEPTGQQPIAQGQEQDEPVADTPTREAPGKPFLWRVKKKDGGETSYLFGTMHLGVDADTQVHPSVWKAFAQSEQVVLEIVASELSMAQTQELLFMPEGQSLRKGLDDKQWQILKSHVSGFDDTQLARVSPLMASVLITSKWLPMKQPMDQVIESRARNDGKSVFGLEGFEETKSFTQNASHVEYLAVMLDDIDKAKKELRDMHGAYLTGDADAMVALVFSDENRNKFPKLYEELFFKRNNAWVPKLVKHLEKGKTFVAVGAGHLLGQQSVVDLLEAKGFLIERIEP